MDVDRKREADWPHWPGRDSRPARRDRLERRLFRDSEREAELEQAHAAIRRLEEAAAAKAAQIARLERAVEHVDGPDAPEPEFEPEPEPEREPEPEPAESPSATYLVFVGTPNGYVLQKAWGDVPAVGGRVAVEGVEHVVAKLGRSPLPADDRRCAYLDPA
jgi:hypothetical protein